MAPNTQLFYCLWQEERIRETLFELLSKESICAVRMANAACCNLVTKRLFLRTHLTFTANTFTKQTRIQALSRIGHHIEHLTFSFPHSDATFLPPLIHPLTGREISFLYTPHTSMASAMARPKYANTELGDILTQQYPPLFHAASNVPSFINAMRNLPNMRHLTIKTPNQDPKERYRRDIVDYALISLRISVERAPLTKLTKLSLSGVHPSAFNYLRASNGGFGVSPASIKRWQQIRKLYVSVESWDFYHSGTPGLDHLKIIDDYLRVFAPQLEKFSFTWLGRKGPCPVALAEDPLFAPPRNSKKLFNEVTGPMSPLPPRPARRRMVMPRLRFMSVHNATMNAQQLRDLVSSHMDTVREFDFENVALLNGGNLDEALKPLTDGDAWSRHSVGSGSETGTRPSLSRSGSGVSSSVGDETLPASSAAAAAASKELFDVDLEGMVFGGANDVDVDQLERGVEEWAMGVTAAAASSTASSNVESIPEHDKRVDDGGLASDIEAAREASLGFSTRLKKRRIRKKKSHRHLTDDEDDRKREGKRSHSRAGSDKSRSRHKHSHSDDTSERGSRERSRSRKDHHKHHHHHPRNRSEDQIPRMPPLPISIPISIPISLPVHIPMPEVVASDDESFTHPLQRRPSRPDTPPESPPRVPAKHNTVKKQAVTPPSQAKQLPRRPITPPCQQQPPRLTQQNYTPPRSPKRHSPTSVEKMKITAPILNPDPFPVLLQPTVYDPSAKTGPLVAPYPNPSSSTPPPLLPLAFNSSVNTTGPSNSATGSGFTPTTSPARPSNPISRTLLSRSNSKSSYKSTKSNGSSPSRQGAREVRNDYFSFGHDLTEEPCPEVIEDELTPTTSPSPLAAQRSLETDIMLLRARDAQMEAEEARTRASALKRAKEAVLSKLTREYSQTKGHQRKGSSDSTLSGHSVMSEGVYVGAGPKDSAAVVAAAGLQSALNLGTHHNNHSITHANNMSVAGFAAAFGSSIGLHQNATIGYATGYMGGCGNNINNTSNGNGGGMSMGARIREGLFGRINHPHHAVSDIRSLEVPLILSRS